MLPRRLLIVLAIAALVAGASKAVIITVDDDGGADYTNIRQAIQNAADGDDIIVADGVYWGWRNTELSWDAHDKHLRIKSENGPANCIIDCNLEARGSGDGDGDGRTQYLRAFQLDNGQTYQDVIDGFTIMYGRGKPDSFYILETAGAGIYCSNTSPMILNCRIRHCKVTEPHMGDGGGIFIYGSATSVPTIKYCEITDCNAINGKGGGIYCTLGPYYPSISDCQIERCSAREGAGIYCGGSPLETVAALRDCTIRNNKADDYGGGVRCVGGQVVLTGCSITGNESLGVGGGIAVDNATSFDVHRCTISDNIALSAGGIYCYGSSDYHSYLANSYVGGNSYWQVKIWGVRDVYIDGCTFGGDGIYALLPTLHIGGCIFWGVSGYAILLADQGPWGPGSAATIDRCDIQDYPSSVIWDPRYSRLSAGGIITQDPLFLDGVHLDPASPCVDAGGPSFLDGDIDGMCRVVHGIPDMGADEQDCLANSPGYEQQYADFQLYKFYGSDPSCWCTSPCGSKYQCDGDGDGKTEGALKYRVFSKDLAVMESQWKKTIAEVTDPCADFDHKAEGALKYRVFTKDLDVLVANWKKKDADLPGNCPRSE